MGRELAAKYREALLSRVDKAILVNDHWSVSVDDVATLMERVATEAFRCGLSADGWQDVVNRTLSVITELDNG